VRWVSGARLRAAGLVAILTLVFAMALALHVGAQSPNSPPHPAAASRAPFAVDWLRGHQQPELDVRGQADILVDVDAREVLWQRNGEVRRAPASLTKLVTAMVAADLAPLDRQVRVTTATDMEAVQRVEPTSTVMGLTAGEVLTVRELMYGLFLRSGNDAAETLGAGIVSGTRFIQLMNDKAAALGMSASHFTTPVGLDDPEMRTTAYDLAVAGATIATRYPELLAISGAPTAQIRETSTHKSFGMTNYNKLVLTGPLSYPGATGMKTAFTDDAGPCMVATATRGGRHLVAVVLDSPNFFNDATHLLDYGFAQSSLPAAK
jgi:serine-type D-Ala-D-Ala carboxypeptidase (penicillin-binding protein 5/6)